MTVEVRRRDQWILRLTPRALRLKIEGCQRHLQSDGEPWPRAWDCPSPARPHGAEAGRARNSGAARMIPATPYSHRCSCKCGCFGDPAENCDGLCKRCWLEWCQGSESHAPLQPNSYLDTYGIGNIWTGWVISQAPELVAQTPKALLRPESPRSCPECGQQMVRRPGAWKCYPLRHEETVVIPEKIVLPRSPSIKVLEVCLP